MLVTIQACLHINVLVSGVTTDSSLLTRLKKENSKMKISVALLMC